MAKPIPHDRPWHRELLVVAALVGGAQVGYLAFALPLTSETGAGLLIAVLVGKVPAVMRAHRVTVAPVRA
jgi:hypothetical protein